jgi:nicotinamide mononucleotide (NMN) deamidase PncC
MLDGLANEIIEHAKVGGITIATAESCSAGRLAQALAKAEGLPPTTLAEWWPIRSK